MTVSTGGFFQLSWKANGDVVRLAEAPTEDFTTSRRVVYEGADTARVMSGKSDGIYFYRLEDPATGAPLTDVVSVTVAHHSLTRAWSFFLVGAIVFCATVILIWVGSRQNRRAPIDGERSV